MTARYEKAETLLRLRLRHTNPFRSDTLNAYLPKNRKMVGRVRILKTRRLENFRHKEIFGGNEVQLMQKTLIIRDDQRSVAG